MRKVDRARKGDRNSLSALQHIMQIQPGSPWRAIRMVMLTTLEVRVAQLPKKVRRAMARRALLTLWRNEDVSE
jgi:hypothetical protein